MKQAYFRYVPCAIFLFIVTSTRSVMGSDSSVQGFEGSKANNTWRICNKTSRPTIWVGLQYNIPNAFVQKGWYAVDRGTCRNILTLDRGATVLYYAKSGQSRWGGESGQVSFCQGGGAYELIDRRVNGQWRIDTDCPAGSSFGTAGGKRINGFSETLVD